MKGRAREIMYWPNMAADITTLANSCDICQKHKSRNARLPMLSHDIPSLPWQVVGADLFYHAGREFLILVDFYSFFFEIKELHRSTAEVVCKACADVFATHGLPVRLCSDNGPPFSSSTFNDFVSGFQITHVTSSPYHPRSNGMAERAVQEAKKLLKKCPCKTKEFRSALLEWRNSPRDSQLKSPVQRLMGRQTRTLLPVTDRHLEPAIVPPQQVKQRLQVIRNNQCKAYNKGTRRLPELHERDQVSVYDTLSRTWSPAVIVGAAGMPRSYNIKTEDGQVLRRTREHLRESKTSPSLDSSQDHNVQPEPPPQPVPPPEPRRSTREKRMPKKYPYAEN